MKIGILTQPLHANYGGLLQAYALQHVLTNMGHNVLTVDIPAKRNRLKEFRSFLGRVKRKYLLKDRNIDTIFLVRPSKSEDIIIKKNLKKFIRDNIRVTETIAQVSHINKLKKYKFDAYIVGSDQVWRPKYSPGISTYFLDFLGNDKYIKRIAYAASFGVDNWEFSPNFTKKCKTLAQKFDAVSVREDSAIKLCSKYLEVNASHVLDPTMLINAESYISLIEKYSIPKKEKVLMAYILDQTEFKKSIISNAANILNIESSLAAPTKKYIKGEREHLEEYIFPPVAEWLRCFLDAAFIITDSFHGVIFSIIFNKQFIVIGNKERGLTRFLSLLKMFKLEDRLMMPGDQLNVELFNNNIDYSIINKHKLELQQYSFDFLNRAIKG